MRVMTPHAAILLATAVLAAVIGAFGGWFARAPEVNRLKAEMSSMAAQAAQATAKAVQAARTEEQRRADALQEVAKHARSDVLAAQRDAAAADRTAVRLREHIARLVSAAPGDPPVADGGQAASGPGLVLSDMLIRLEGRSRELAAYADQARAAGAACERSYDALR